MSEYIPDGDWNAVRRAVDAVSRLLDTGGKSLRLRGTGGTLTFPGGSQNATPTTVLHGMGKTPTSIQLTPIAASTPLDLFVVSGTVDADSFDVGGRTTDGSSPGAGTTQNFYWLAIG